MSQYEHLIITDSDEESEGVKFAEVPSHDAATPTPPAAQQFHFDPFDESSEPRERNEDSSSHHIRTEDNESPLEHPRPDQVGEEAPATTSVEEEEDDDRAPEPEAHPAPAPEPEPEFFEHRNVEQRDSSDDSTAASADQEAPSEELLAERRRYQSLLVRLEAMGLAFDPVQEVVVTTSDAHQREELAVKEARVELERLSNDLALAEEAKREILPAYEKAVRNAELKDRVDALKKEIAEEETTLKRIDGHIRSLDAELSSVTAQYKRKRDQRQQFTVKFASLMDVLYEAVSRKVNLTTSVDEESSPTYINPGDCIESAGHLATSRERDHLILDKQLRELQCACEFKEEECETLRSENTIAVQRTRESRDEAIRALVYGIQDERNALLCKIEELITTTSDQALNLKVGHVHVNAPDRQQFNPTVTKRHIAQAKPAVTDTVRAVISNRKTALYRPTDGTEELRFLAEKNKEMLMEIAELKSEISKAALNRTDAIQSIRKTQLQTKRDRDHYEATLQKLDAQLYAEQAALRAAEKENSKLADAIEQLQAVVRANKKHIEHCRTKTVPLPIE